MRIFVLFVACVLSGDAIASSGPSQDLTETHVGLTRVGASRSASLTKAPRDAHSLTLQMALGETLARNPRLIALRRQYEAMRLRPAQALALAPPSFEAQIWQWPFNSFHPGDTNMYMFTVGQSFPGGHKRQLRATVAEKDAELSLAAIVVEASEVIDEVKRVYDELYLTRRGMETHHANADVLRQFADVSEVKYTTGGISQQDMLKSVVELSRLHEHLLVLGERERLAQARLNTLLDRRPEAPVGRLLEPREDGILPALADLQRAALDQQPDLHAARVEVERAAAVLAAEREESKPDFFVKGGYMHVPQMPDSWTATVGITWPNAPWSGKGFDARVAEARAAVEAARARYAAGESAIRFAVHESYVRAEAAQQRAALLRTSIVPQSDQTLAVSCIAYQANQGDFLTLIDNQRVLLDVRLAYYRALNDLEQARADLERAVGRDLLSIVTTGATSSNTELTLP